MAGKEGKRAFTVDDVAKIKTIESVATSPDGGRALYVLRSMNLDENRFDNDIYMVPMSSGESLRLTEDGKSGLPAWSPDGRKIAYVQGVEEGKRIWLMDPEGENRRKVADYQISNASLGVSTVGEAVLWSPDGSRLAFLATLEPHDKDAKIRVVDRIMYKAFYGYSDMRRRHVFVASPLGSEPPRQLTFGDFDEHSMAWSPDGGEIAFVSNRTGRADHNMHLDIYAVEVESGETRRITESVGAEYYPAWSPDGRTIAYTATTRGDTSNESTPEDRHIWVVGSDGDDPRDLTLDFDRACNGPLQWTPDGGRILFTAYDRGRAPICSVSLEGGEVTKVTDSDRFYGNLSLAREGGRMAYTSNDPTRPDELYSSDLDGGNEVRLTDHNGFLEGVHLDWPEEFGFKTADGLDIQGWIYKPMGFDPSGKHPALLNIKGGPSGMRGYGFNAHLQLLPAQGYVQFIINYRGSSGYGQAFSDAVVGDMLGGEYRDNMEALDHMIGTRGFVDADRMGVWGVSYGGYLTNWIVTQTDRFRAAVSISSVSNLFSQWGASAIPSWVEVEIGGLPWERMDLMLRQSPIMQADKVRTPVLFLHGELDFDTPIVEAEQMFMALKKHGVEAVMVRYADDGHGIRRKPANQLDSMRRVIAWFDGHLKGKVGSV
jgi:dipeptidyl aminopeptidase/acylaminoacyl peptidase